MDFTNLPSVSVNEFAEQVFIPLCVENGQTAGLFGAPGAGKSAIVRSLKAKLAEHYELDTQQVGFYEFHASTRDEVETHGYALPVKRTSPTDPLRVEFAMSPVAVDIQRQIDAGCVTGILFVDEVTQCGEAMQKALRDVIDPETRMLGGWQIPTTWVVVCAGNRVADGAGSTRLLSHFSNAMARFNIEDDVDGWINNFAILQDEKPLHPLMIANLKANASDILATEMPIEDVQVCTFRSYTRAAQQMHLLSAKAGEPDVPVLNHQSKMLMQSLIGFDATEITFNWLATYDKLPTNADIQSDPETALLPDETDLQFAATQIAVSGVTDPDSAEQAARYIRRCRPDMAVSAMTRLLLRVRKMESCILSGPTIVQFIAQHSDLLPLAEGVVSN